MTKIGIIATGCRDLPLAEVERPKDEHPVVVAAETTATAPDAALGVSSDAVVPDLTPIDDPQCVDGGGLALSLSWTRHPRTSGLIRKSNCGQR